MATSRKATYLIFGLGLLGGLVAVLALNTPPGSGRLEDDQPAAGDLAGSPGLHGRRRKSASSWAGCWSRSRKAVRSHRLPVPPLGAGGEADPRSDRDQSHPGRRSAEVIARVMDVDDYEGHIATSRLADRSGSGAEPLERVHFYQRIIVPGVAKVQHELVLVDAGIIEGYRVAYWYLLGAETEALDPEAAREASPMSAPGWWPRGWWVTLEHLAAAGRCERVALVFVDLRRHGLAKKVVEGNIDGIAAWAKERREVGPAPRSCPRLPLGPGVGAMAAACGGCRPVFTAYAFTGRVLPGNASVDPHRSGPCGS